MKQSMATSRFSGRARNAQLGQAIVLIAILILVLFGMLWLAIDATSRRQSTPPPWLRATGTRTSRTC